MNPQLASIIAVLFVIMGTVTVFIMLEMTGRRGDRADKKNWFYIHKILGYFFIFIFVVMLFLMIRKAAGLQEDFTSRAVVHISLALALVPLLVVKVMVVRRYPQHLQKLPLLGVVILTFSFVLTGISAGYYALHRSELTYTTLTALDNDILDMELGKSIMSSKCNKCHSLERVFRAYKSDESWVTTVNRMAFLDSPNITTFDVKQVLNYLIQQQKTRQDRVSMSPVDGIGSTLVAQKCTICHDLDRVLGARKNDQEWLSTVNRMITTMDDPDFLSEDEVSDIVIFLSRRGEEDKKNQR